MTLQFSPLCLSLNLSSRGLITPPGNPCGVHMDSWTPWMFHGFHGIFFGSGHTQIQFFSPWTVHGQSTYYHDFYNFHGIHADSPWTPRGLSPRIIHGLSP